MISYPGYDRIIFQNNIINRNEYHKCQTIKKSLIFFPFSKNANKHRYRLNLKFPMQTVKNHGFVSHFSCIENKICVKRFKRLDHTNRFRELRICNIRSRNIEHLLPEFLLCRVEEKNVIYCMCIVIEFENKLTKYVFKDQITNVFKAKLLSYCQFDQFSFCALNKK